MVFIDKERMFEAIVEAASQGILAVDSGGTILLANTAAAGMFGYSREEMAGSELSLLIPQAVRDTHHAHISRYMTTPTTRPMGIGLDLAGRRKDGTEFPVEVSLSYAAMNHGPVAIAMISDITLRKQLEEQVARSQKMDVVGRLAGGIAHDFNNMLTIILGYDRLLLQRLSPLDALRGYAEEIARAAERASALTRHLLAFSKHERLRRDSLNLNAIVKESLQLLRVVTGESISLVANLAPDLGWVLADKDQFHQVLANLVLNARDAMPSGGQITIETSNVELGREYVRSHLGVHPGPYVLLSVTDTGTGMDAETKEHIFEPFFTTKGPDKGTGLGLTTVWATVKNFGGDVWVYSEIGKGTTFKIYLPRVTETGVRLQKVESRVRPRGNAIILLVEDEPGVRKLTTELIQTEGYTVLPAADPFQAIQLCMQTEGPIDLLLTDLVMPQFDGFQLAQRISALRPGIKILYMSGYSERTGNLAMNGLAPDSLIQKPFTLEDLLDKIAKALKA
ncbi:MAG: PAS domain S-box protein [Bryobacterales bacterium]|nr:PAS domain S-box protein [Bryobacterales bacterium]